MEKINRAKLNEVENKARQVFFPSALSPVTSYGIDHRVSDRIIFKDRESHVQRSSRWAFLLQDEEEDDEGLQSRTRQTTTKISRIVKTSATGHAQTTPSHQHTFGEKAFLSRRLNSVPRASFEPVDTRSCPLFAIAEPHSHSCR